jgi:hypothetical protein
MVKVAAVADVDVPRAQARVPVQAVAQVAVLVVAVAEALVAPVVVPAGQVVVLVVAIVAVAAGQALLNTNSSTIRGTINLKIILDYIY